MSSGRLNREESIERIVRPGMVWDILIIGGGATGVGIAVDAANRGFKTLLLEQSDFGKGTSSRSTKLVHGGVRYLQQGNLSLVRESLQERYYLQKNAPHLVKDLPFLIPCRSQWERYYYGFGLKLYDLLAAGNGFGNSHGVSFDEAVRRCPGLRHDTLVGGVIYHDGQFDDARLLINMARTASKQGGCLLNYFQVKSLQTNSQQTVKGVLAVDRETGEEFRIDSHCVVNATGPFCDAICELENPNSKKLIAPSQGVHIVLPRSFYRGDEALIVPNTTDGRVVFMIPWHGWVIVGTTDTLVSRPKLEPLPRREEIDFLLKTTADYLSKPPARSDLSAVFTGIRPLVKNDRLTRTASLSRDHLIQISKHGLVTVTGGKWTTYRRMAEDCVDRIITEFRFNKIRCKTRTLSIHGAMANSEETDDPRTYYGTDLAEIQKLVSQTSGSDQSYDPSLQIRPSDVIWAVRQEMARTADDVLARRTRSLFCNARATLKIAPAVISLMSQELNQEERWCEKQLKEFRSIACHFVP